MSGPRGAVGVLTECTCALLAAVVMAVAGGPTPVSACGPFFPNRVLLDADESVLAAPVAYFAHEIQQIPQPAALPFAANVPKDNAAQQTADADAADLHAALALSKTPPARQREIEAQHKTLREALRDHTAALAEWKDREPYVKPPVQLPRPQLGPLAVPDGLPGEFADYLRGAIAYHQDRIDEARAAWQALLDRPEAERRFRSTWAAFMIGKTWLDADPARAVTWFEQVRTLARQGCADSLGLAASSLGWQAKAELQRHDYTRAIELYLAQHATGDPTAVPSLRFAARKTLAAGPDALRQVAAHASACRVVTAYVLVQAGRQYFEPSPELVDGAQGWLAAAEATATDHMPGADRLAWAAYQFGDMEAARRWLDRAEPDAPVAQWIRSKLLLRAGKINEAAALLTNVVRALPEDQTWNDPHEEWYMEYKERYVPREEAYGELGVLCLTRGQYVEALDALLRGDFWEDAAYVAERVLTPDELIGYVDRRWPPPTPPRTTTRTTDSAGEGPDAEQDPATRIRHLLARQLTRIGRWKEARDYYPEALRPRLDAYIEAIRAAHDRRRSTRDRADSFWQAARIARREGMELLGTELEPDGFVYDGQFDLDSSVHRRAQSDPARLLSSSQDERDRLARHAVLPELRFHYRYIACDHAWSAAELMPDESDATARVLCTAGSWLKSRDPQAADRFYKALVKRCGTTPLGREADRLRWFPKIDEP